jgi:hypothetical protein
MVAPAGSWISAPNRDRWVDLIPLGSRSIKDAQPYLTASKVGSGIRREQFWLGRWVFGRPLKQYKGDGN